MQTATRSRTEMPPAANDEPNLIPANGQQSQPQQEKAPASLGKLTAALFRAQQKCRAVVKDEKAKGVGYKYVSADTIIEEAKEALAESGLAIFPGRFILVRREDDCYEIQRVLELLHESGESKPIYWSWPVDFPNSMKLTLGKSVAVAATTSIAYFYRDLLQMPRINESDNMDAHRERSAAPSAPEPEPEPEVTQPESPPPAQAAPNDLVSRRNRAIKALGIDTQKTDADGKTQWMRCLETKMNGRSRWEELSADEKESLVADMERSAQAKKSKASPAGAAPAEAAGSA